MAQKRGAELSHVGGLRGGRGAAPTRFGMPWCLVALHLPDGAWYPLPTEGVATVGRRLTNSIVCKDLAVSGQHCVLHCSGAEVLTPPEVEDRSTNGTYVNEVKLARGQRQLLAPGDVLA